MALPRGTGTISAGRIPLHYLFIVYICIYWLMCILLFKSPEYDYGVMNRNNFLKVDCKRKLAVRCHFKSNIDALGWCPAGLLNQKHILYTKAFRKTWNYVTHHWCQRCFSLIERLTRMDWPWLYQNKNEWGYLFSVSGVVMHQISSISCNVHQ